MHVAGSYLKRQLDLIAVIAMNITGYPDYFQEERYFVSCGEKHNVANMCQGKDSVKLMKKGITYWSFPDGLTGKKGIKESMMEAKEAGFEGVELSVSSEGELSLSSTKAEVERIKRHAQQIGVEIIDLAVMPLWDYPLTSSDPATRERAEEIVRKAIEFVTWLDVDTLLIIPGAVDVFFNPNAEVVQYDTAYKRAKESLLGLVPFAEKNKVYLAIENVWNKFLLSPLEFRDFIDQFNSEYICAYFDVGNILVMGYPEHWIRILGGRIKRVHIKDFKKDVGNINGFVSLLEGDVNWKEVMKALKEINYDGFVTAEIMPPYKYYPEVLLENTSIAMDKILGRK